MSNGEDSEGTEDSKESITVELIQEFFDELKKFKEEIIGKAFDEIYIDLDGLIDDYENKFKMYV